MVFSVGVPVPGEGMGNHARCLLEGLTRHKLLQRAFVLHARGLDVRPEHIREAYWTEKVAYRLARCTRFNQYVLRDNLFDAWVAQHLGAADVFYGWTHHALWSLKRAKRQGMLTVLERANTHPLTYQRLLAHEYAKYNLRRGPYHPLILKKQLHEIAAADYFGVTSEFTRQSLLEHGIAEHRIVLTPLGVDSEHFAPRADVDGWDDSTFRVVYVGQLCLRKGVQYLVEAWTRLQLPHSELVLAGDVADPAFREIAKEYFHKDATITLRPHTSEPITLYQQANVAILPTLEDGFGLVTLEAMACGAPVIVTEHAGVKDCVRRDIDGFVIPPSSVEGIADTLNYCYAHRSQLKAMGRNARKRAEQFPWSRYQDGVAAHLKRLAP